MNEGSTRDFLTCSLSTNVLRIKNKLYLKKLLKIRLNSNFLKIHKYHLVKVFKIIISLLTLLFHSITLT